MSILEIKQNNINNYYEKYLKYKNKYLILKNQIAGAGTALSGIFNMINSEYNGIIGKDTLNNDFLKKYEDFKNLYKNHKNDPNAINNYVNKIFNKKKNYIKYTKVESNYFITLEIFNKRNLNTIKEKKDFDDKINNNKELYGKRQINETERIQYYFEYYDKIKDNIVIKDLFGQKTDIRHNNLLRYLFKKIYIYNISKTETKTNSETETETNSEAKDKTKTKTNSEPKTKTNSEAKDKTKLVYNITVDQEYNEKVYPLYFNNIINEDLFNKLDNEIKEIFIFELTTDNKYKNIGYNKEKEYKYILEIVNKLMKSLKNKENKEKLKNLWESQKNTLSDINPSK